MLEQALHRSRITFSGSHPPLGHLAALHLSKTAVLLGRKKGEQVFGRPLAAHYPFSVVQVVGSYFGGL